ncbi:MAG: hypothetical protein HYX33_02755 [Actinobacteria bacterium]|nr:hypothetical protein [Actinomycetota bacterium]
MTTLRRTSFAALVAASALAAPALSLAEVAPPGDIPDNTAYVVQVGNGYSLKTPEGWARTAKGGATTYADKFNSIRVELVTSKRAPSVASVRAELGRLAKATPGYQAGRVSTVTRPAGRVLLATYRALSAPNAVTGKRVTNDVERYAFWKSGRTAIVTLQAPKGSDNVDPWKTVTTSFRWTR